MSARTGRIQRALRSGGSITEDIGEVHLEERYEEKDKKREQERKRTEKGAAFWMPKTVMGCSKFHLSN